MPYANNKGTDEPAIPIIIFVIICLDIGIMPMVAKSEISRLSLASVAVLTGLTFLVAHLEDRFSHDVAHSFSLIMRKPDLHHVGTTKVLISTFVARFLDSIISLVSIFAVP